jgi:hypothetical protein
MKLFGTILYPTNRYLTLQFSRGGKSVTCEDYFDNMVGFFLPFMFIFLFVFDTWIRGRLINVGDSLKEPPSVLILLTIVTSCLSTDTFF